MNYPLLNYSWIINYRTICLNFTCLDLRSLSWIFCQKRMKSKQDVKLPNQIYQKFQPGNQVVVQDPNSKEWSLRGKILKQVAPQLFKAKVDKKTILRWNQQQLGKVFALVSSPKLCLPEIKGSLPPSIPLVPVSPSVSFGSNESIISYRNDKSDSDNTIAYNTSDSEQTIEYKMSADKWNNEPSIEYKTWSGWVVKKPKRYRWAYFLFIQTNYMI